MWIEPLIKDVLLNIPEIDWQPGTFPQMLTSMNELPVGCWNVSAGSGEGTNTDPDAIIDVSISITLWAGAPDIRAEKIQAIRDELTNMNFAVQQPGLTEMRLTDSMTAYIATLLYRGRIDSRTRWVYKPQ